MRASSRWLAMIGASLGFCCAAPTASWALPISSVAPDPRFPPEPPFPSPTGAGSLLPPTHFQNALGGHALAVNPTTGEWSVDVLERSFQAAILDPVRHRMLVFGDYNRSDSGVWALSLSGPPQWTQVRTTGTPPPARNTCSAVYDSIHDRMIIFGGWGEATSGPAPALNDVWALSLTDPPTWSQLDVPGAPTPRAEHAAIYDPVDDQMLVFGGRPADGSYLGDVWALHLSGSPIWLPLSPSGPAPQARARAQAVYDAIRHRMIVNGGYTSGSSGDAFDTWALSLEAAPSWTMLSGGGQSSHYLVYDSSRDRLIALSGEGYSGFFELPLSAAASWQFNYAAGYPFPETRTGGSAIYDIASDHLVLFGGYCCSRERVWSLDFSPNPTWRVMLPTGTIPEPRNGQSTVYDSQRDRMVMFGGTESGCGTGPDGSVWVRTLSEPSGWSVLLSAETGPGRRVYHSAVYDPVRDRMLVFGGYGPTFQYPQDLWSLEFSPSPHWIQLVPSGNPPSGRDGQSAVYDPAGDRVLVFGGHSPPGGSYNDLWELSLGASPTWRYLAPAGPTPPARAFHSAIYDPIRNRMIVWGGWPDYSSDVWGLDLTNPAVATWSQLIPAGESPQGRGYHTAIYDPVRDRMVIFGGEMFGDTWSLSFGVSESWNLLQSTGPMATRANLASIYDPVRDRMVLFGGWQPLDCSDTAMLTWGTPPPPPAAPSVLVATLDGCPQHPHLTWQDNSLNELTFDIEVKQGDPGTWTFAGRVPANVTTWDGPDLNSGSTYAFRVRACNSISCSPWSNTAAVDVGPCITRILPDHVNLGDTGVDLLIEGNGFQANAIVRLDPSLTVHGSPHLWNGQQVHLNIDIDPAVIDPVSVSLRNGAGPASNSVPLPLDPLTPIRHPRDYAPTLWFAPDEQWFPTSPFFEAEGKTYYDSAGGRNSAYLGRGRDFNIRHCTVYYYVHPSPVPFPAGGDPLCLVYEYWCYYTYDEYKQCGTIILNQHQHDWEKFFVFVDRNDGRVRGLAGRAHLDFNASSVYEFPTDAPHPAPYHPVVMVELGGHAMCPDMDGNGTFTRNSDVNGCARKAAWGIQDGVTARVASDMVFYPGGGEVSYELADLNALKVVVDPRFTTTVHPRIGSFEEHCASLPCVGGMVLLDQLPEASVTFTGSRPVAPDARSAIYAYDGGLCSMFCMDPELPVRLAHIPIEHAWRGDQAKYLDDPRWILPGCYHDDGWTGPIRQTWGTIRGWPGRSICDVGWIHRSPGGTGGGSSWKTRLRSVSLAADSLQETFAYTRVGPDGDLSFTGLDDATYTFFLNMDLAAPYRQTLVVSAADSLIGVDGTIALVPRDRYFTLRCLVQDTDQHPIPGAQVRFFVQPDSLVLPTLTDSLGVAFASADTSARYRVMISAFGYRDSLMNFRGSFGDTITAAFRCPFDLWDPTAAPPPRLGNAALRQNYPNPFNPTTVIEFELPNAEQVTLEIFAVTGHRVRMLVAGQMSSGLHRLAWSGLDDQKKRVPSGIYTYRLRAGAFVQSRKLVLVR